MKSPADAGPARNSAGAFTLVEMLMVAVIAALLLGLGGVAVQSAVRSQNLAAAARQVSADLEYATLLARKDNRPVEVVFYEYTPREQPDAVNRLRAYQLAVLEGTDETGNGRVRFLTDIRHLPDGVVFSSDSRYTTLAAMPPRPGVVSGGGPGENHTLRSYQIRPDGTTTLAAEQKHCLTLLFEQDAADAGLPANFRTVLIDPLNARTRLY